ncbi:Insulinase (Peptidase family M16) family protein [Striga hermonthica]|uniref:Insulinase (Peptidase family M16) family protein n=1 Tax=Striga hermonthica TaxID=68872 RepID=A0A9N7MMG5_STRHE|nr:Insulinase (Peptidase family M16) family protein [Striga hermonthica]
MVLMKRIFLSALHFRINTRYQVSSIGAEMLEFLSDYGKPSAPCPAAIQRKYIWMESLEIPKALISAEQLRELKSHLRPSFIPIDQENRLIKICDEDTGIIMWRLSNGIPVNYRISKSEANSGVMRLIVGGGRAAETAEAMGAVIVGVRTLSEGGCVGNFTREQVELFCVNHLINCSLESTEEFISMEIRFTLRDDGMRAAFQLLHMVLEQSVWLDDAFDRAKQFYLSYYRSIPKSIERATAHKLIVDMLNEDERFVEPTPHSLQQLTLEQVKDAVMSQFVCDNMEVSIVGDFSEEDVESCILEYLGTARRTLLMRHEAEIKSNTYWLGLMAHLQATSVPSKDISCIKDLISLYEAATVEDVYTAYEQLQIDENSLYSCIGIVGAHVGESVEASLIEEESVEGLHNVIPIGRGSSTVTRPTM